MHYAGEQVAVERGKGHSLFDMADPHAPSRALEALLLRYGNLVRWAGRRSHLDDADLDEVLQDVRVRLWRARPSEAQLAATPASYVYRTAMSAAVDLVRRRRRGRTEELAENQAIDPRGDTGADVEAGDTAALVHQAVDQLSDNRRPVVRMYLVGYQRHEIATLLGWSDAKTRNLLYRGLEDLRAGLRARGIGPEAEA